MHTWKEYASTLKNNMQEKRQQPKTELPVIIKDDLVTVLANLVLNIKQGQ